MNTAIDLALFRMIETHKAEQKEQVIVQVVRNAPKKEKTTPIAKAGVVRGNGSSVQVAKSAGMVATVEPLDAAGFMLAMRNAGKRPNKHGVLMTDQSLVRGDMIQAIAAYVGYDPMVSFGAQEQAARAKANRELSGRPIQGPTREEQRNASRSWAGYVHGMPDATQKRLADLKAREQESVDTFIQHVKDARNHSRPLFERKVSIGMARIERERLETIREDIASMVQT